MKRIDDKLHWRIQREFGVENYFLLDLDRFRANYRTMLQSALNVYPNVSMAYSYKTNYLPRLCWEVDNMGGYAEVVSEMEYELATKYFDIDPARVIINGPIHSTDFVNQCLDRGSIFQVDSIYLLETVARYCDANQDINVGVSIRFNFELTAGDISRFGIHTSDENMNTLLNIIKTHHNIYIRGFHCHFSTSSRSLASFAARADMLLDIATKYFELDNIEYFNFGGGFFGSMPPELKSQFQVDVPEIGDYSRILAERMKNRFSGSFLPKMIIEPGTALAADTMQFVCKVQNIKRVANKKIAVLDGSILSIKPTLNDKVLPCYVITPANTEQQDDLYQMTGYTCMEKDYMCKDFAGSLQAGDYVGFTNVGAYTIVNKPPFIKTQDAVVSIEGDKLRLEKRSETSADIISTYNRNRNG